MIWRDAEEVLDIKRDVDALLKRARKWPNFWRVERRVKHILVSHPDFKSGVIDALRLFKAYRLALKCESR